MGVCPRLIFQRILGGTDVPERRPCVCCCSWDFSIPKVLRRSPTVSRRFLKLRRSRLVDDGCVLQGTATHRADYTPVFGGHSRTLAQTEHWLACLGAGTPIMDVEWLSYGGATAKARGMFAVNDCQPNCALGEVTLEPTSFTVSYVGPM